MEGLVAFSNSNPVSVLRSCLVACPDSLSAPGTSSLSFLADRALGSALQAKISEVEKSLAESPIAFANRRPESATLPRARVSRILMLHAGSNRRQTDDSLADRSGASTEARRFQVQEKIRVQERGRQVADESRARREAGAEGGVMAVYRPTYRDVTTGELTQSKIWWYNFSFAGRRIQESSRSTRKTIATAAEKNRHLELERGFNQIEDNRQQQIRTVAELPDEYLEGYKLRQPRSATFAEYSLGHVERLIGNKMVEDITDATVKDYQTARLKENAAPKSINEETGFLLRMLGEQGDFLRAKLRRQRASKLAVRSQVARAFTSEEKAALLAAAKRLALSSDLPVAHAGAARRDAGRRDTQPSIGPSGPPRSCGHRWR